MESLNRPDSHLTLEGKVASSPYGKIKLRTSAVVVNFVASLDGNRKGERAQLPTQAFPCVRLHMALTDRSYN